MKGAGVDCAMFPLEVYTACGLIPKTQIEHYPQDWHLHSDGERYLGWVLKLGGREIDSPQPGDLALFKVGRSYAHGAIVEEWPVGYHSVVGIGVVKDELTNGYLRGRTPRFFSLFNKEQQP